MSVTYSVPVALQQSSNLVVTNKPDHVDVTLRGLRKYVRAIDPKNLCIAVDAGQLAEGANHISVTSATLGLPNVVSVVDYNPMNLTIVAEQRSDVTDPAQEQHGSSPDANQQRI
jgi:YbbR domain-containing protein